MDTLQCGQLTLDSCDVSSSTGSGVSSEGGSLSLASTRVHDCTVNGLALYADLEGIGSEVTVQKCQIRSNKLNGILIREGSHLVLQSSSVEGNGGYGLANKVLSRVISSYMTWMSIMAVLGFAESSF